MNKQDFFRKGSEHAQAYRQRGISLLGAAYPAVTMDGMMSVALSGSWQAMAYKAGFDSERPPRLS